MDKGKELAEGLRERLDEARDLLSKGKVSAAERRLTSLTSMYPDSADCWTLLAKARLGLNRTDSARQAFTTAMLVEPNRNEAPLLLFALLLELEHFEEAEVVIKSAITRSPKDVEAMTAYAKLRCHQKQFDEAVSISRAVLAIDPGYIQAWTTLGLSLFGCEDFEQAIGAFRTVSGRLPENASAHRQLGAALSCAGYFDEAADQLERSVKLDPHCQNGVLELVRHYGRVGDWQNARRVAQQGLEFLPDTVVIQQCLKAIEDRIDANSPDPTEDARLAMAWDELQEYGVLLQRQGRFDDSVRILQDSLRMEPNQGMGYYRLTEAKCFELNGLPLANHMLPVYQQDNLVPEGRIFLCFALGKTYDKEREYERAMRYFEEGNDLFYGLLRRSQKFFDAETHQSYIESIKQLYSRDLLDSLRGFGSKENAPIFIIGMIRSGTTLLDQIVSSHSHVRASGEQEFWKESGIQVLNKWFNLGPDRRDLSRLAEEYLFVLRTASGESPRITDKMPLNYEHAGLIHLAFPNARFLHIRRNPIDTCLSIYMTLFGSGPPWTYNRANIVAFYRGYLSFMEHWREAIPSDRLLEIDYEELVTKPEETSRQILGFCDLDWEDQCLRHEANPGFVKTPSRWQARQPMYGSSIDRWKRYEPWLGELLALKDLY
ncbi:MAG: sulfotransferase [Fimbriimonas sp.]|nr:sulfotransferase [Fimbriimonas sp.]